MVKNKVKADYGLTVDDALAKQLLDIAKQQYGGNLDIMLSSAQVRNMLQLYGMATGQKFAGISPTAEPYTDVESGGSLYTLPATLDATPIATTGVYTTTSPTGTTGQYNSGSLTGASVLQQSVSSLNSQPGQLVPIVLKLDPVATNSLLTGQAAQGIADNPRLVAAASLRAAAGSFTRRQSTAMQLQPGLVTR
jgi:hypothetical protein